MIRTRLHSVAIAGILAVLVLAMGGCAFQASTPTPTPRPLKLTLGAGPPGLPLLSFQGQLKFLIEQEFPGSEITVVEGKPKAPSPEGNLQRLARGELDIAPVLLKEIFLPAVAGEPPFDRPFNNMLAITYVPHGPDPPLALLARADLPEDVVFDITRLLFTNTEKFQRLDARFVPFTTDIMLKDIPPDLLHPGARRFYEEQGLLP